MAKKTDKQNVPTVTVGPPQWITQMASAFQSGRSFMFLLTGNVRDWIENTHTIQTYVPRVFKTKEIVVFYNRASGISFGKSLIYKNSEKMREAVIELLGIKTEAVDPLYAQMGASPAGEGEVRIPGEGPNADVSSALGTINQLMRAKRDTEEVVNGVPTGRIIKEYVPVIVIVDYVEKMCPDGPANAMSPEDRNTLITLLEMARDKEIEDSGNICVMVTSDAFSVHQDMRQPTSGIEQVEIPLPTPEERLAFAVHMRSGERGDPLRLAVDYTLEQFAAHSSGLTKRGMEDVYLLSNLKNTPVSAELVNTRKQELIRAAYGNLVDMPIPKFTYADFGGNEPIKDWFRRHVIRRMKEGDVQGCPMGVMLMGPAGTGKSVFALATAKESGINFISLNLGKLKGQYVGQSEAQLEKALQCIYSNIPCITFIDEIDQALPQSRGGGGDSGVSSGQLKRLLEVMADQEFRGKVLWMTATNRPDLVDAALKRPGRMDKLIPFLAPETAEERIAVIHSILTRRAFRHDTTDKGLAFVGEATDEYTQAELEALILKAFELAYDDDLAGGVIKDDHFKRALELLLPSTSRVKLMTDLALESANDLDLFPPRLREKRKNMKALRQEIEEKADEIGEPTVVGRRARKDL